MIEGMAEISIPELNGDFIGLPNPVPPADDPDGDAVDANYPVEDVAVPGFNGDPDMNLYKREEEDSNDGLRWELEGDDGALFRFTTPHDGIGRRIHFRSPPDYEDPQDDNRDNVYEVTVVVCDTASACGGKAVRVEVENVDETGTLMPSPEQPILGDEIIPALEDKDGIMTRTDGRETIVSWQWYWTSGDVDITVDDAGMLTAPTPGAGVAGRIPGATAETYTTDQDDVGRYLHVRVIYRDGQNTEDDPVTPILTLDERDGDDNASPPILADPNRVLIGKTANAVLEEAPGGPDMPFVDGFPEFGAGSYMYEVKENTPSTGYVGAPIVAMDDEDDAASVMLDYDIGGPNSNRFALADAHPEYYAASVIRDTGPGQIVVKPVTHLDFEDRQTYTVELGATDSQGQRTTTEVTIKVTNVNEAPSEPKPAIGGLPITGPGSVDYPENGTGMVATYRVVGEELIRVTWSPLAGNDAGDFTLVREGPNEGALRFNSPPDYENPTDADEANTYQVTVVARVTTDKVVDDLVELEVTVTVTNVDEDGGVTLEAPDYAGQAVALMALDQAGQETMAGVSPVVGREITAALMDYDNVEDGTTTWQWAITDSLDIRWTDIAGETMDKYTPVYSDIGKYLQVTAHYSDGHDDGKVESVISAPVALITSPAFASATAAREVAENTAAGGYVGAPVEATDADGDTPVYALSGTDMASFDIDEDSGRIMVASGADLNFEVKDTYMVTVEARDNEDGDGNSVTGEAADATIEVTISIMDLDESGIVASLAQPVVGVELPPAMVTDDDGVVDPEWQWARSDTDNDGTDDSLWDDITDAKSDTYTPQEADAGKYLRVLVNYTDNHGTPKREFAVSGQVIMLSSPEFDEGPDATREVAENTAAGENIGDAVMAMDADGDTLVYSLGGTDAGSFAIDSATGQLMTMAPLDYETKMTYMVMVEVSDNEDDMGNADTVADDSIAVTITVTNMEEMGEVTFSAQPVVGIDVTASVTDPDVVEQGTVEWQWASSATMGGTFTDITGATDASYMPAAEDEGMYLQATATYDDGEGSNRSAMMVSDVVVAYSSPMFDAETATRMVAENTAAGENIGDAVTATDADGDTPVYALSGADVASFDIDVNTGQLMTMAALDYETQDTYTVTVEVRDNEDASGVTDAALDDSIAVTIYVINVDEMGTVTLSATQPAAGAALMATLDDPDGGVTGATWQWASSADGSTGWTDVATSDTYTPVAADAGNYLRATASYTDAEGPNKSAAAVSANAVTATPTTGSVVGDMYDANEDGVIQKSEAIQAVFDYFDRVINKADAIEVIMLYIAQ